MVVLAFVLHEWNVGVVHSATRYFACAGVVGMLYAVTVTFWTLSQVSDGYDVTNGRLFGDDWDHPQVYVMYLEWVTS